MVKNKLAEYFALLALEERNLSLYESTGEYWEVMKYFEAAMTKAFSDLTDAEKELAEQVWNAMTDLHIPKLPPIPLL